MTSTRSRLLSLFRSHPGEGFSFREIAQALGTAKGQGRALREALKELVAGGALAYVNRRYRAESAETPRPPEAPRGRPAMAEVEGTFSAHRRGFAFVEAETPRRSFFIPPPSVGGALDGDRVRIRISTDRRTGREEGRVTAVLQRRRELARGHLRLEKGGEAWVYPLNEKLPAIFVGGAPLPRGVRAGALVEVRLTAYPADPDEAPTGRIERALPDDDSPEAIIDNILADRQVEPGFPPPALAEAAAIPHAVRHEGGRRDLRDLPFVTIDGADARDFDDAVCLEPLPGGQARLWVAIADVARYVRPGTTIDQAAYRKGTSTYLPHRALPMLPEVLSNDLCSLRPRVVRLTLTCEMTLDRAGQVRHHALYESTIRSRARLTYDQVQRLFDGKADAAIHDPEVRAMLLAMRELAAVLAEKRQRRGALRLILPETRFDLDTEGMPLQARLAYPTEATRLIEQFMLEANETVALHASRHDLPILYRVHDPPPADQVPQLKELLERFGFSLPERAWSVPGALNPLLTRIERHPQREQLELAILKTMAQAQYRAHNAGHYGLAAEHYTHFTSPIRRYPDLLVHRALKAWLHASAEAPAVPIGAIEAAGTHLSDCERIAADVEQQVARLFKVLLMERHLGETFTATVSAATDYGLRVELVDHPVEGVVPLESLPDGHLRLDRRRGTLRGGRSRREIGPGERLRVQLVRADRQAQALEFAFRGWGWEPEPRRPPGPPGRGAPRGRPRRKGRR